MANSQGSPSSSAGEMGSAIADFPPPPFKRLLVANRSEIAIRVMRAAAELHCETVAIYSEEDRFALHRFKADQSYQVGEKGKPLAAYLNIEAIIAVAKKCGADAIHPGYGFLSENPDFADACSAAGITFVGPSSEVMRKLGNKVSARNLAVEADVPVMPATKPLPELNSDADRDEVKRLAAEVGYPLMLKASWGGGGRGMRVIEEESELLEQVSVGRSEAAAAFGNGEVYLEKLIRRARHVEVQLLGDTHGNLVHLYERDCTVQRRNQKVVERAPAPYFEDDPERREELCNAALKLGKKAGYSNAGTVEFLLDSDTGHFYFIEVNPRVQVEHTVTEEVTGIDIVKSQIRIAAGGTIGEPSSGVPMQNAIQLRGHALQCRVTTEDPENGFVPDYGRIRAYRGATGFGIRLDGGTAYSGALITPFYDSLLEKVTAWGSTPEEAMERMYRAIREFRIRGLSTNLAFLERVIRHPDFVTANYTTRFIDLHPELFDIPKRRDRATRLLRFLGDTVVNGNPEVQGRELPAHTPVAPLPEYDVLVEPAAGYRQKLLELGPEAFAGWMKEQKQVLLTDTSMRDAHQSLLATRVRSYDIERIAPAYAHLLPGLFSMECWGGATFDVSMRFLQEDPWDRLRHLRTAMPNMLLQMLLRASNAVGYKNYPDNVVQHFVEQAADNGIDIFRVFDSLNWADNMRVAIDAVRRTDALCEAAICYSGDMLATGSRSQQDGSQQNKYDLNYYVKLAKELEAAGAHILAIKDMAGVCKPEAARQLVTALKQEVGLPIHFHTHDTSGISAASVLAAIEAGCDAVDGAMDAVSGLTSQPNLGAIVEALRGGDRDPQLSRSAMRDISRYWEVVRQTYSPFESDIRSGTADVYRHAMPGGQYTNLRQQARSLGIEHRWPECAEAYAEVNEMFGDIVKVTPSSKVVGDMALFMVTSELTAADVLNPEKDIAFPESVVSFFKGELGQPVGGFPEALQRKVLKNDVALTDRPGASLPPVNLDTARSELAKLLDVERVSETDLSSWLLYPKVFEEYAAKRLEYGNLSVLPTSTFFYGMTEGEELTVDLEQGKTLLIRFLGTGETDDTGEQRVFFELNGQPRTVKVAEKGHEGALRQSRKANPAAPGEIAAPMPGVVTSVAAVVGQTVEAGDPLLSIEAMKMETSITAVVAGVVKEVVTPPATQVEAKDLLVVIE